MEKAIEVLTQDLERIQKSLTEWNTQVEAFSIKIRNSHSEFMVLYSTLSKPNKFVDLVFDISNSTTFLSFWSTYIELAIRPLGIYDHYESRTWGLVYKKPFNYDVTLNFSTDSRKKIRFNNTVGFVNSPENHNFQYYIETTSRMRFSDRFMVSLSLGYDRNLNDYGWVETDNHLPESITWFGKRNVTTVSNVLNMRYIFSTKVSLTLRARHYWSQADYSDFYMLLADGSLSQAAYETNPDVNFNAFSVDMNFGWYFAPGSELNIKWKNSILGSDSQLINNYFEDLGNTLRAPQTNGISIRFLYYIDYLYFKKLRNRNKA